MLKSTVFALVLAALSTILHYWLDLPAMRLVAVFFLLAAMVFIVYLFLSLAEHILRIPEAPRSLKK